MSLIDQIRADSLIARKAGNKEVATLLTTLYSEAVTVGKNAGNRLTTDAETIAVAKKFIKGIDETISHLTNNHASPDRVTVAQVERKLIEHYMPKQMSVTDLANAITDIVNTLPDRNPKQMGIVMKQLKDQFDGQYDGKIASQMIKDALI